MEQLINTVVDTELNVLAPATEQKNTQQLIAEQIAALNGVGISKRKKQSMQEWLQNHQDLSGWVYVKHVAAPKPERKKRLKLTPVDGKLHTCIDCYNQAIADGHSHDMALGFASKDTDEMAKAGKDKNNNPRVSPYCKQHASYRVGLTKKRTAEKRKAETAAERLIRLRNEVAQLEASLSLQETNSETEQSL